MKIIKLIQKYSTGKNVILLFSITMIVYLTILFYSIPKVVASAPEMKLFDVSPSGYTTEYATSLLNAIGLEGRGVYLSLQLPLDFIYPGLFIISYSLLFAWLLKKGYGLESKAYYALYLPILAGLFDYMENVLIIIMLKAFPDFGSGLVTAASLATIIKSVLSSTFFTLLILSIIQVIWKFIFKSREHMTVKRMDNVLIVVNDLEATKAFFIELGLKLEGETTVEGPLVGSLIGIKDVRATLAMMRTPDGQGIELDKFHTPNAIRFGPVDAPVNTLGIRRIMFAVDDINAVVARMRAQGAELIGEMQYEDTYRLAYIRGPEGIIIGLAEQLG